MPDDRQRILQRLQSALRNEHLSAASYEMHAERARTLQRKDIARTLLDMAASHKGHIRSLETRIRELGGEPAPIPDPNHTLASRNHANDPDLCLALEQDLKAEDTEIEEYEILARQSDEQTSEICHHNIEEDRRHLDWLREQLIRGRNLDSVEESSES